jgi:hypothetical protein
MVTGKAEELRVSLKYRISHIGWYNFELLVQTLLKAVIGPGVTSFGGSKDKGRDAEFDGPAKFPAPDYQWTGKWVFQVKYVDFEEQGVDAARSSLKSSFRSELERILPMRQKVANYVLLTDVPLTAQSREDLEEVAHVSGFKGNFACVDGKEICQFLDIYGDIRRAFPQLLGLADLDVIVNRDLYARSQAYLEVWQPRLATYVQTEAHAKALSLLKKKHFIVLDGPPEAGKTTIAAALALIHATDGFEVIDVRTSNDVFRVPDERGTRQKKRGKKALFVADDAIGSISLVPARADEWSRDLPGIIRQLSENRLLVWTARRYILEEALAKSRLDDAIAEFPRPNEVLVEVGKLSLMQKAEMLYNHAKQANLSAESRKVVRDHALEIASHPNFTPLRISQLTNIVLKSAPVGTNDPPVTWQAVAEFLSNPSEKWIQAFRELSQSEQILLSSILDFEGNVAPRDLRANYEIRVSKRGGGHLSFEECINRLDHSFLTVTSSHGGEQLVSLQHPSLRDMLLLHLRGDADARRRYLALASPSGLAAIIGGISESSEREGAPQHAVVPTNEEEVELFLSRLRGVSQGVLTFREWELLLSGSERLIPTEPKSSSKNISAELLEFWEMFGDRQLVEPVNLDLNAFAGGLKGKIIGAVLEGFAARRTLENSQRFKQEDWIRLLTSFYKLTGYLIPPIYPSFTLELCRNLSGSIESIRLANLIYCAEPLVAKQRITRSLIAEWKEELEAEAERLTEEGEAFSSTGNPDEYYQWDSESQTLVTTIEDFCRWSAEPVEAAEGLQETLESATHPREPEEREVDEQELPVSGPYWSVQRLFEDL